MYELVALYMGCFYYFYIIIFNMQLRRLPSFRKKPVNGRYFQNILKKLDRWRKNRPHGIAIKKGPYDPGQENP
jgi:hypothetical protein